MRHLAIFWFLYFLFRELTSLTTLDLSHNRLVSFQGYYYMRSLTTLNLSDNHISDLGNFTMLGMNLQNLNHLRLNQNRLVLCDAFFNQIIQMKSLQVVDIKSATMPCLCEISVSYQNKVIFIDFYPRTTESVTNW